jgi:hypothetical protein
MPLRSTLSTVNRTPVAGPRNRVLISGRRRNFSLPLNVQSESGAILFSCLLAFERLCHEPVPLALAIFKSWDIIMYRYNFSSAFTTICIVRDKGVRLRGRLSMFKLQRTEHTRTWSDFAHCETERGNLIWAITVSLHEVRI